MRYDISKKNKRPAASQSDQAHKCSLFLFPVPTRHHSENKLIPVPVPWILTGKPITVAHTKKQKQFLALCSKTCGKMWPWIWSRSRSDFWVKILKSDRVCFDKKTFEKNTACDRGHKFRIVTFCDRHKCHTLSVTGTKAVSVSVWNPDRNGSESLISN